jgi:hypothetical protein
VQNRIEELSRRVAAKGHYAGCHFIENRAEGEKVGSPIQSFSQCLLRRHVSNRTYGTARTRQVLVSYGISHCLGVLSSSLGQRNLCQPKVEDLGMIVARNKDVGGLNVAMNNALTVSGFQSFRDAKRDAQQPFRFQRITGDEAL